MRAELYTTAFCPFCVRAKQILDDNGIEYVEHRMDGKPDELMAAKRKYGHPTVPIVLLDDEFIGGCDELETVARTSGLG